MSVLCLPPDFAARALDTARRCLGDVPECRDAELSVRWLPGALPILVVHFAQFAQRGASPACAVALMTVRRGTLHDVMPGRTVLTGERLRDTLLRSVHQYLRANEPSPHSLFAAP